VLWLALRPWLGLTRFWLNRLQIVTPSEPVDLAAFAPALDSTYALL